MDKDFYLAESYNILRNDEYFRTLQSNPLPIFKKKFPSLISNAYDCQILTKDERDFILIDNPATPYFYFFT